MAKRVPVIVSTKNAKFTFVGDGVNADDIPKDSTITVLIDAEVPESAEEAAGEAFYGSEANLMEAVQEDWKRRCANTARPVLRTAEQELDWQGAAQTAADSYKPGRRGGFAPKVTMDEADQYTDLASFKEFLSKRGVLKAS